MEVSITILVLNALKEIILHLGCPGVPVVSMWYSGWVATGGGSNKHSISSTHTWYTMYVRICIWYNWFHHYFKRMKIFCITPANFRWHCQSQRCRQPGRRCWRLTLTGRIPRSGWECRQSLLPAVCGQFWNIFVVLVGPNYAPVLCIAHCVLCQVRWHCIFYDAVSDTVYKKKGLIQGHSYGIRVGYCNSDIFLGKSRT